MAAPTTPTTPFTFQHTPQLPEILAELGCSLVVSTYQAGKVIMIRSDGERLVQLPRTFEEPMGLAVDGDRMAVATKHSLVLLANEPRLAASYPRQPDTYDALFVPRSVHHCGALAVHDMVFTEHGLVGVNTLFSCLFQLDPRFSFRPVWKPRFVSALSPEDRCHLTGSRWRRRAALRHRARRDRRAGRMACEQGARRRARRCRERRGDPAGLAMPHSPRVHDGTLYALSRRPAR